MESILDEGNTEWTLDLVTDAATLLLAINTIDFISALLITTKCLKYLLALTHSFQAEAKDIVQALSEINRVKAALQDVRDKVEKYHNEWVTDVEVMCDSVNVKPSLP